jgi:hypothetical protein
MNYVNLLQYGMNVDTLLIQNGIPSLVTYLSIHPEYDLNTITNIPPTLSTFRSYMTVNYLTYAGITFDQLYQLRQPLLTTNYVDFMNGVDLQQLFTGVPASNLYINMPYNEMLSGESLNYLKGRVNLYYVIFQFSDATINALFRQSPQVPVPSPPGTYDVLGNGYFDLNSVNVRSKLNLNLLKDRFTGPNFDLNLNYMKSPSVLGISDLVGMFQNPASGVNLFSMYAYYGTTNLTNIMTNQDYNFMFSYGAFNINLNTVFSVNRPSTGSPMNYNVLLQPYPPLPSGGNTKINIIYLLQQDNILYMDFLLSNVDLDVMFTGYTFDMLLNGITVYIDLDVLYAGTPFNTYYGRLSSFYQNKLIEQQAIQDY